MGGVLHFAYRPFADAFDALDDEPVVSSATAQCLHKK